jgi:hypothetical protein
MDFKKIRHDIYTSRVSSSYELIEIVTILYNEGKISEYTKESLIHKSEKTFIDPFSEASMEMFLAGVLEFSEESIIGGNKKIIINVKIEDLSKTKD